MGHYLSATGASSSVNVAPSGEEEQIAAPPAVDPTQDEDDSYKGAVCFAHRKRGRANTDDTPNVNGVPVTIRASLRRGDDQSRQEARWELVCPNKKHILCAKGRSVKMWKNVYGAPVDVSGTTAS